MIFLKQSSCFLYCVVTVVLSSAHTPRTVPGLSRATRQVPGGNVRRLPLYSLS
ncbi:hypothetical protein PR001_g25325 [Phytophthora rubi]|uniref:RxLR effector protein n=1 Tax=Phytophthora rubi TaxID=129364 RepID=A0A6A3I1T8_9STRA|nr:hypothetical protein PR001_g25325 [Phytophthora rubi]